MRQQLVIALVWLAGLVGLVPVAALAAASSPALASSLADLAIEPWLAHLQDAPRNLNYSGVFVVSTGSQMASARIWHLGLGQQQIERVESLSGTPRSTFRNNDQVVTFLPTSRTVVHETREVLGLFSDLPIAQPDAPLARFYRLSTVGHARVAGWQADVFELMPIDALRFGYRIWSEQKTGLLLKLQTLDQRGNVLEQATFSEVQLGAPMGAAELQAMMNNDQGYRVVKPQLKQITLADAGWALVTPVPGFALRHCYRRAPKGAPLVLDSLQCVFSDGLASVSVFIEPFEAKRHARMLATLPAPIGATSLYLLHTGDWCLTAVGEAPAATLKLFTQAFDRKR